MRNSDKKYMTKPQAERIFKSEIYDAYYKDGNDKPAARTAWNDFVDHLNKDGKITEYQAATWVQPKYVR